MPPCTCPMSVREAREHSVACPEARELAVLRSMANAPPVEGRDFVRLAPQPPLRHEARRG